MVARGCAENDGCLLEPLAFVPESQLPCREVGSGATGAPWELTFSHGRVTASDSAQPRATRRMLRIACLTAPPLL